MTRSRYGFSGYFTRSGESHWGTKTTREIKDADGIVIAWIRQEANGTYKKVPIGNWQQICPHCGEYNAGPHSACAAEIDTITAPAEGATVGDYQWFHERAKELGYHMAVIPADK